MPDKYITPSEISIIPNHVVIVLYHPIIIAFHIKCQEVADSFKLYFDLIWKNSKLLKIK